ncbi:MAG TPA: DUF5682 family protein, partial [Symbiobacteriaceae bacterium]|nr:DUF5682 family protein [Symbiobacteriaceae bacterium]
VALKAGQAVGARLAFCDIPAGATLTTERAPALQNEYGDFTKALADTAGFDTFEELWEAAFEQDLSQSDLAGFIEVLTDFGGKARSLDDDGRDPHDTLREQYMAATARALAAEGIDPGEILLVCGAAHAESVARHFADGTAHPTVGETRAETALIPFSFPRLSEQSGYGAGNRAPWFYQQVWELQGDYSAAARLALARLGAALREKGQVASLAQTIDAYNLATVLAAMRTKRAPGVAEITEAAVACFGQGNGAPVEAALRQVLIGEAVGRVTQKVGRTPLQAEFYRTADRLGLPIADAPKKVQIHPTREKEAAQSVFLHRLMLAEIPFARPMGTGLSGTLASTPLEQLSAVLENWEVQWSPATDGHLVERTARGSTFAEVCGRVLQDRLAGVTRIDEGSGVLLQMALCDLTDAFPAALERCESLAADSVSFPALARAAYQVQGLLTYGAARRLPVEQLADLARRLFARAVLALPAGAVCNDDAVAEVQSTLTPLYDLVRAGHEVAGDPDGFWEAVTTVAAMAQSHPQLRGLALVLLELDGRLPEGELANRLRYWLSTATDAAENARLVAGLFHLNRGIMIRNRALIRAVTEFLQDLEIEQLKPLLPVLRRSLGDLSPAERSYLAETLEAILGLGGGQAGIALKLSDAETDLLTEHDRAVANILQDWRDRYGIG